MRVLFVNHSEPQCGVYQFGRRVFELAKESKTTEYSYAEPHSELELTKQITENAPQIVLYNWYPVTMAWLTEEFVATRKDIKHFFLFHDGHTRRNFDKYLFSGAEGKGLSFPPSKVAILPRPLFRYDGEYLTSTVPTIGSFGFGGWQKGFVELVQRVNEDFETAIINIQMPFAYFGDRYGTETLKIAEKCRVENTNPDVTLNIDHTFLSTEDTLKFLAGNALNVFLYSAQNQGLSSVIDYALSVKRPIAISRDSMFKHIFKEDICADIHSLQNIMKQGTTPLEEFYVKWHPDNFASEMDKILNDI